MALPSRRHDREKASESEGRSQCTGEGERIRWTMDESDGRASPKDDRSYSQLSRNTNEQRTIVSYYYTFMVWLLLLLLLLFFLCSSVLLRIL